MKVTAPIKHDAPKPKLAFGGAAPSGVPGKKKRPPLIPKSQATGIFDGFDKTAWMREHKLLKRDANIEERDRFRPLMCLKREFNDFILECEKIEKKDAILLRKD